MPAKRTKERPRPYVPQSLKEAIIYFADEDNALRYAVASRWPEGVTCPYCGGFENSFIATRKIWRCRPCKKQFSVRVGTIFEDSPIRLGKWFTAIWMLLNCKNGISSYEIARDLDVTQKTAWFLLHRIRAAIKAKSFDKKLAGIVEADECFIGGLFKNMHKSRRAKVRAESDAKGASTMRGAIGKTLVQAVLERDGQVRTQIIDSNKIEPRAKFLEANAEAGSQLMTDEGYAHERFAENFTHDYVNHQIEYVRGNVHCNGVENFWSLLARMLHGT